MRGRKLVVPDIKGLRPSSSRVREALFNILGDMNGDSVLDLFAGSGIIALEALSRGATTVLSIESHAKACHAMRVIQSNWGVEGWVIQRGSIPQALPCGTHFNLIYADPPYGQGIAEQVGFWLRERNITFDTLVVEESSRNEMVWMAGDSPYQIRKYGETTLYFFQPHIEPVL